MTCFSNNNFTDILFFFLMKKPEIQKLFFNTDDYRPRTKYEGRYCFHRCLSVHTCGLGGSSQVRMGGTPFPGQDGGGTPFPGQDRGGTPFQVQMEYEWCTPGYPPPPPGTGWGFPIKDWMRYPPPPPQSEDRAT